MINILTSTLCYFFLTILLYTLFLMLYKKTKFPLCNPLLLTTICMIIYLSIMFKISDKYTSQMEVSLEYKSSLALVSLCLNPLTVALAVPVLNKIKIVKKYWLPILVGTVVGAVVSITSVLLIGRALNLDNKILMSFVPKSVTTPIAVEICNVLGGYEGIAVGLVILNGIMGALFGPLLFKLFKIKDNSTIGMSMGGTSHALGTSKAIEINSTAGAISSIAIITSGILTVIICMFI